MVAFTATSFKLHVAGFKLSTAALAVNADTTGDRAQIAFTGHAGADVTGI
jgi:hypothetical protein